MSRHSSSGFCGLALALVLAAVGCGSSGSSEGSSSTSGSSGASAGGTSGGGGASQATGLPCELAAMLQEHCGSCHGSPPSQGAPYSLLSYEDLVTPSASDPSMSRAERAVLRMKSTTSPMPPKATKDPATAEQIALLEDWIAGGKARGTCNTGGIGGTDSGGAGGSGGGTGGSGGTSTAADDLPCDVKTILEKSCLSCHGSPLLNGATLSLLSWAELQAPSSNPPSTVAQAMIARIKGQGAIMPPAPASLSGADIATLESWVSSGAPKGTGCGAPVTCQSGSYWPKTCMDWENCEGDGPSMNPGVACLSCHNTSDDPEKYFWVAGTVYPTLHEEPYCYGANGTAGAFAGLNVVVKDAKGVEWKLPVGGTGNFHLFQLDAPGFAFPYEARVEGPGGKVNAMGGMQKDGDCNGCHTQAGSSNAPGRIQAP